MVESSESIGKKKRERIIIHIHRRFGNLKKTYLGDFARGQCLNAHSNMGTIAIVPLPMFTWSKFDIGQLDFMADV